MLVLNCPWGSQNKRRHCASLFLRWMFVWHKMLFGATTFQMIRFKQKWNSYADGLSKILEYNEFISDLIKEQSKDPSLNISQLHIFSLDNLGNTHNGHVSLLTSGKDWEMHNGAFVQFFFFVFLDSKIHKAQHINQYSCIKHLFAFFNLCKNNFNSHVSYSQWRVTEMPSVALPIAFVPIKAETHTVIYTAAP